MNQAGQLDLFKLPAIAPSPKTRHLLVGGSIVPYVLRQGRRRRLSMTIDERGLAVGAPHHVPLAEIEAFVGGHGDWVIAKLAEYAQRVAPRQVAIRHGTRLPLLGGEVEVAVEAGANRIAWRDDLLVLAARADADLDLLARRALQRRALPHFVERADYLGARLERPLPPIALSSARTRWGSCSESSGIRLNWRLIHLAPHLVDYVIAHELAHLAEMNHSARFWAEVERIYPDWRAVRAELKLRGREIPLI
ncbi:MAG: M48 family metallopeptidase [Gammaproteobacteria bacterium]|nr:M48 family metallopeptidase [Gammaproteobacteria bacterium]MBU1645305.1 M48 family metallopeptidase [Gammaproteobacteria bacterium]MBU1972298.1 M48 family metallopeptidase [Gammaproteobacteria bacterium]